MLDRLKADRRAVTAIEYALIAAFLSAVIVLAARSLGSSAVSTFNSLPPALFSHAGDGGPNPGGTGGLF